MKKFWAGLIVCAIALFGVINFSACSKKANFDMSNLKKDYETILDGCTSVSMSGGQITFDYTVYKNQQQQPYFENVINTVAPYTRLVDFYNPFLESCMSFAYNYMNVCSTSTIKVAKDTKNRIDTDLNALKIALIAVDNNTTTLAESVMVASNEAKVDYNTRICEYPYRQLFNAYNTLFEKALNFNYDISNLYFNHALSNSIADYSNVDIKQFDASKAVANLKSKTDYQVLNLTRSYYNTHIKGEGLTTTLTTKTASGFPKMDSSFDSFKAKIASVSLDSTFLENLSAKMTAINENNSLKQSFYEESVNMSNIELIMKNDLSIYETALNEIVYLDTKSNPNATTYELFCVKMIEDHNYIVDEYNKVLVRIINIINNAGV